MISIEIEGVDQVIAAFERFGEVGHRHAATAVRATAEKIRSDAVRSIQRGPKTGIVYEREGGQNLSETHQASAPGEPPATDTGALVSNSSVKQEGIQATVAFNQEYASDLEYGTMKILPRPFLQPAVDKNTRFLFDKLKRAIEKSVRDSGL